MSLSPTEKRLIQLYLTNLATERKTTDCGAMLLHVLSDLQHLFDMQIPGDKYLARVGHRSVTIISARGKQFLYVPCADYMKWAIEVGEADPHLLTNTGHTVLDWLFDWFNPDDDNWHLVTHKKPLIELIKYLVSEGVESVIDPKQVLELLSNSYAL